MLEKGESYLHFLQAQHMFFSSCWLIFAPDDHIQTGQPVAWTHQPSLQAVANQEFECYLLCQFIYDKVIFPGYLCRWEGSLCHVMPCLGTSTAEETFDLERGPAWELLRSVIMKVGYSNGVSRSYCIFPYTSMSVPSIPVPLFPLKATVTKGKHLWFNSRWRSLFHPQLHPLSPCYLEYKS